MQKNTNQSVKQIALADMVAQSGYQRPTSPPQVKTITDNFDESRLGILTVSHRDGKYHLIDGSHRSHAMRNHGYTHATCIVLTGLTYEQEAELFSRQNENKRMLKPLDLFKSGLEANDELAVRINEVVGENGFQIGSGGKKNYRKITAIMALYAIAGEYGIYVLDDTLCLIDCTWSGFTKATQSMALLGVAEFVSRYGMVEFSDRLRDKCLTVWYEYEEEMRNRSSDRIISPRDRFCRLLVLHYNAGLGSKSKKRLVWED